MALLTLLSLSLVLLSFTKTTTTLTPVQCQPDQSHALIQLKQGFKPDSLIDPLIWNASTDCCKWDGITCDKQTGMVTALNLFQRYIQGELNPALFNLSSLQYLNLAGNHFINVPLPQIGFERLPNLTYLDLSYSGFAGQVPISMSSLTNLISLNLSSYISDTNPLYLHDTSLNTLLRNLSKLQVLHLDGVDISLNGSEWGKAVYHVAPTIQVLSMVDCGLRGNLPDEIFHLSNIRELDLSENSMLSGQVQDSIGNLQYLSTFSLNSCSFYGEVPLSIRNLTALNYLDLGSNILTGTIPMSLFLHPSLKSLDLSMNQLSGYLPKFSNGSSVLANIFLQNNNLQGQLPISIFKSPQLVRLDLSSNNISGKFNFDTINHNKKLDYLDLSNNQLSITEDKIHNESFYASFPQMTYISLASGNLTKIPSFLRYQTNIESLFLSNNKIDGAIPKWLCSKTSFFFLNLSHNFFTKLERDSQFTSLNVLGSLDIHSNRISGPVPLLPQGIHFVDFSSNYFFSLPAYFISSLVYIFLSNNSLTGDIPFSICNTTSLQVLDLSYNNLTGTIPPCLLENTEFQVLNLRNNKLSGPLLPNINQGCKYTTIDLSRNRINGSLPHSLMNCNTLEILDLGNNQIVDRFPFWLGNLIGLTVLVLRSNQFYGTISNIQSQTKENYSLFPALKVFDLSSNRFGGIIPKFIFQNLKAMVTDSNSSTFQFEGSDYYQNSITVIWKGQEMEIKSSLSIFSSLDLSQNGISREIPEEIGQLMSLDVLNLSHNSLSGPIPGQFANLHQLQSLDLSFNHLSGHIPQELTSLTFLSALNLSYNNMVGEIPQGQQFSTFSNASYMGNPGLCGSPLSIQCTTTPSNEGFYKCLVSKSSTNIIGLSVSIGAGLGVGFASVIWAQVLWKNGRERFNLVVDGFYFRHFH